MTTEQKIAEIKKLLDRFLAESLYDPDIAVRSRDFKEGYEQGFRESFAATLRLLITHKISVTSSEGE